MNKFQNIKFSDLSVLETLAETHAGNTKVYLCRHDNVLLVCKAINKSAVVNDAKAIEHVKNEKQALNHFTDLKCGYVCELYGTFQDADCLYLLLEMVNGLPLHKLIQMLGPLNLRTAQLVGVQVCEIMRRFHAEGYIYRDIKLSNFMMNDKGRVKMIDLGKSKLLKRERTYTICGTTHAMPPQIYRKQGYSYEFDYYSFGVLIYELLVGQSPFGYAGSNKSIRQDVEKGIVPQSLQKIDDERAKDIIIKLLAKEPKQRLGSANGFDEILNHPFMKEQAQYGINILDGKDELSVYDDDFAELLSQIEDLGLEPEKYNEIPEDDPFYKFL